MALDIGKEDRNIGSNYSMLLFLVDKYLGKEYKGVLRVESISRLNIYHSLLID